VVVDAREGRLVPGDAGVQLARPLLMVVVVVSLGLGLGVVCRLAD